MALHYLKSWPRFFAPLSAGTKQFEIRKDDRDFGVDDVIIFQEWQPHEYTGGAGMFTGREIGKRITYIVRAGDFRDMPAFAGLVPGYCILGLIDPGPPITGHIDITEKSDAFK